MAYSDPSLIRKHTVKLSFNENEAALVNAFCHFTGEEKAAFLRSLILDRASEVLGHGQESGRSHYELRGATQSLQAA